MPKRMFGVIIPIAGHLYCEVEATTEEEAIEKAMDMEHTIEEIEEWDYYQELVTGNVMHYSVNKIEVTDSWEDP